MGAWGYAHPITMPGGAKHGSIPLTCCWVLVHKSLFQNNDYRRIHLCFAWLSCSVCCLSRCSALLPGCCRWVMPAGSSGAGRGVQACRHWHCLPSKPQCRQHFVLTEESVSHAFPKNNCSSYYFVLKLPATNMPAFLVLSLFLLSFLFADKSGGTKLHVPRERREETAWPAWGHLQKKSESTFCAVWGGTVPSSLWISTFGKSSIASHIYHQGTNSHAINLNPKLSLFTGENEWFAVHVAESAAPGRGTGLLSGSLLPVEVKEKGPRNDNKWLEVH